MKLNADEIAALKQIIDVNMGVRSGEKVFILAMDPETLQPSIRRKGEELRLIAEELYSLATGVTEASLVIFPSTGMHGVEPPSMVWESVLPDAYGELVEKGLMDRILKKQLTPSEEEELGRIIAGSDDRVDVVVALTYYSTSHTIFRKALNRFKGTRYASMPLFERYMLTGAMKVDYREVEDLSIRVRDRLRNAEEVYVTAPNGTELKFVVRGREFIADTGILTAPGSFGNLPAGEVFVAPVEGETEGVLVIEYGPEEGRLETPVRVTIEKGRAVEVSGEGRIRELLESKFREDDRCRNVAELGIGTNAGATHVENILEAEKILGTIHVAFGDNSSFGGKVKAPFHQDFVLFHPTVEVYGEGDKFLLHREGNLLV